MMSTSCFSWILWFLANHKFTKKVVQCCINAALYLSEICEIMINTEIQMTIRQSSSWTISLLKRRRAERRLLADSFLDSGFVTKQMLMKKMRWWCSVAIVSWKPSGCQWWCKGVSEVGLWRRRCWWQWWLGKGAEKKT